MIVSDPRNPLARQLRARLVEEVPELDGSEAKDGVLIVIGGDGFMLRTVAEHGLEFTYLGLSAGRMGFLLNDVDDWPAVCERLRGRRWTANAYPVLEARIHLSGGRVVVDRAVNDVYLERASGQTAHLKLTIDGEEAIDNLTADGLITSTALGSTAYNFSAGGPACHPSLGMLLVTPICAHRPRLAPFALPASSQLRIDVLSPERRPVRAVADGRSVEEVSWVTIGHAAEPVRIAYLEGHDFTTRMVGKILLS